MSKIVLTIFVLFYCICVIVANDNYTDEEIVNAIYIAEGGSKAKYLYGIRSVKYKNEADAKRICLNTVRNNRKRYLKYGYKEYKTFLEFLASRYAPIGVKNDPKNLNRNWLRNVKKNLEKIRWKRDGGKIKGGG